MSSTPRVELEKVAWLGRDLLARWAIPAADGDIVGSVRRRRETVGDLEIVVPVAPSSGVDPLYEAISADCPPPEIFGSAAPSKSCVTCEVVQGLKPRFLSCSLLVTHAEHPRELTLFPVQIFRYTPANRGWITFMRTGPADLGKNVLIWWKKRFNLAPGEKASVDGHLVDNQGRVVEVPTEHDLFRKLGITYRPPEERDAWLTAVNRARDGHPRTSDREAFR